MDVSAVIYIISGIIVIGTAIITFFNLQVKQNMKIEQLEKELAKVEEKQSKAAHYQIETEKNIVEINGKLDHIMATLEEIKKRGC